jgi:hypothetical protein
MAINERERIRYGFKGKTQAPLFMVWREYLYRGRVEFAAVIFNSADYRPARLAGRFVSCILKIVASSPHIRRDTFR